MTVPCTLKTFIFMHEKTTRGSKSRTSGVKMAALYIVHFKNPPVQSRSQSHEKLKKI